MRKVVALQMMPLVLDLLMDSLGGADDAAQEALGARGL